MEKEKIITVVLFVVLASILGWQFLKIDFGSTYDINGFRRAYLGSQYTGGVGLIPDNTVFAYAAGAYIQGANPLKINPEMPPLGKYIIGLSILFFNNINYSIAFFGSLSIFAFYLLARELFDKSYVALIPVLFFASEKLFLNQFKVTPMLDIVQLPFIFLSFYFFYKAVSKRENIYYLVIGLTLGFVISIKVMITGILIAISWIIFFLVKRELKNLLMLFLVTFPVAFFVLVISYLRILVDDYSFWYFLLVQKWVLLYQGSKIQFPFSAWRLIFFNQWQAWWGDYSILKTDDWRITWPIITILSFVYIFYKLIKKIKWNALERIIAIWVIIYSAFISIGAISTRHLLPFLPFLYLLSIRFLVMLKSKILKL